MIFLYRVRFFLLGFGLSGLYHEDFLPRFIHVLITAVAIMLIELGAKERP